MKDERVLTFEKRRVLEANQPFWFVEDVKEACNAFKENIEKMGLESEWTGTEIIYEFNKWFRTEV